MILPFKKRYLPIHKNILSLAIPSMVALIAEPLLGVVDTALVGHLGTLELSVLAIITTFFSSITWIFSLFVSGTTASIATLMGEKKVDEARSFFIQNQVIALITGTILAIIAYFIEGIAYKIMGADGTQIDVGHPYYMIRLFSFPLIFSYYVSMGFLRGMKDVKTPMYITLSINILNCVLDYFLIYGIWIIPKFGLKGAAMATLFSQFSAAVIYILVIKKKFGYILSGKSKKLLNFSLLKSMFQINRSMFLRSFFLLTGITVATAVASRMGRDVVGAHQVGMQMWLFCSFAMDSFAIAGQTMCGNLMGKRSFKMLKLYGVLLQYWGITMGTFFAIIFAVKKSLFISLFTSDPSVIKLLDSIFIYIIIYQPIGGIIFILDGILVGTLDIIFLAWQSFITSILVFVVSLLYTYKIDGGITGIWISLGFFLISRLIMNEFRFITEGYKKGVKIK
jgi:putative MATE family efflux protein